MLSKLIVWLLQPWAAYRFTDITLIHCIAYLYNTSNIHLAPGTVPLADSAGEDIASNLGAADSCGHPATTCGLVTTPGLILGLYPANDRRRYFVTTSLIDWAQN